MKTNALIRFLGVKFEQNPRPGSDLHPRPIRAFPANPGMPEYPTAKHSATRRTSEDLEPVRCVGTATLPCAAGLQFPLHPSQAQTIIEPRALITTNSARGGATWLQV